MSKYTVESGRGIARTTDGKVLVTLHRVLEEPSKENGYVNGRYTTAPWEADDFTHVVALGLNHHEAMAAMLGKLVEPYACVSYDDTPPWVDEARAVLDAYDREKASR